MDKIKDFVKQLEKCEGIIAVYLFGSYARNEQRGDSDIDICIITENIKDAELYFDEENIDVSYFWRLPISIRMRVFKEGIPLLVKNREILDKIKISTFHEYLDFKPLINKYLMERFSCTI